MHAAIASYLESGPIDVDDALPLDLHINLKSDYDNMGCENIALSSQEVFIQVLSWLPVHSLQSLQCASCTI